MMEKSQSGCLPVVDPGRVAGTAACPEIELARMPAAWTKVVHHLGLVMNKTDDVARSTDSEAETVVTTS